MISISSFLCFVFCVYSLFHSIFSILDVTLISSGPCSISVLGDRAGGGKCAARVVFYRCTHTNVLGILQIITVLCRQF